VDECRSRCSSASGLQRPIDGETPLNEALCVDRVSLTIGSRHILSDISFSAAPGEFVGLIGSNGAGKTTLLRVLLGLLRPSSGSVTLFGEPVKRGSKLVGYVAQRAAVDPDLPIRSRDFVALGIDGERWGFALPSKERSRRVEHVLEAVGALAYANAPIGRLSGGEQQRLFIAQALLSEPKLLLMDEPLSNLDLRSVTEIVALLDDIRRSRNVTVLFVTHDVNPLIGVMDRVAYVAAGRAVVGTVEDVVREDVLSSLYGYRVDVLRVAGRVVVLAGEPAYAL
jgi:zinc/manganese transport system ATP-binding protein